MQYKANEPILLGVTPWPESCTETGVNSGTDNFPFTATATVEAACNPSFAVEDLDFGTQGLLNAAIDTTAVVGPQCTNTTPYQVGLDNGQHAVGNTRRMHNGTGRYGVRALPRCRAHSALGRYPQYRYPCQHRHRERPGAAYLWPCGHRSRRPKAPTAIR